MYHNFGSQWGATWTYDPNLGFIVQGASYLTVDPDGNPWIVTLSGEVKTWVSSDQGFISISTASCDDTAFVIHTDSTKSGTLAVRSATDIYAVGSDPDGTRVMIEGFAVWHFDGNCWERTTFGALEVSVDPDGTLWMSTMTGDVWALTASGNPIRMPGSDEQVAASNVTRGAMINNDETEVFAWLNYGETRIDTQTPDGQTLRRLQGIHGGSRSPDALGQLFAVSWNNALYQYMPPSGISFDNGGTAASDVSWHNDWDPSRGKVTCPGVGADSSHVNVGEGLVGISVDPSNGQGHAALCRPRMSFNGSAPTLITLDQRNDIRRTQHWSQNSGDWDPNFYKLECGSGEYASGVSQDANGQFHGILCTRADNGKLFTSSCEVRYFGDPSSIASDWSPGYQKADCDWDEYVAGVSFSTGGLNPHALLCCGRLRPATTVSLTPGGSYALSCASCSRNENVLTCQCKKTAGSYVSSSLLLPCSYDVANCNGQLNCGGCPAAAPIPQGSYQANCTDCAQSTSGTWATGLQCHCPDSAGNQVLTSLNQSCSGDIANCGGSLTCGICTLNDTDAITYFGSWQYISGRGLGDYRDDVHFTSNNGDYFQYSFTGVGVDFVTERFSDEGNADVYIDGVLDRTVSCYGGAGRVAQAYVYRRRGLASGPHTIKVVKKDGTYMLLDALKSYH